MQIAKLMLLLAYALLRYQPSPPSGKQASSCHGMPCCAMLCNAVLCWTLQAALHDPYMYMADIPAKVTELDAVGLPSMLGLRGGAEPWLKTC